LIFFFISEIKSLAWSDEQTRLYLELRIDEKLKGNIRKHTVNEAGRQSIIDKFYEVYGVRHQWKKFGIKFTTCKKQYETFRKLTHNRTGLGYFANGSIDMSEDWWNERCKVNNSILSFLYWFMSPLVFLISVSFVVLIVCFQEWSGARKIKDKPVPNTDLMQKVFGTCHISGAEGWTAQQGEKTLDKTMSMYEDAEHDAEGDAESRQIPPTQDAEHDADAESWQIPPSNIGNGPSASNFGNGPSASSRSKASKKRSRSEPSGGEVVAEVIRESLESRDKILSRKNELIESHPELTCNQLRAMEVLHSMPTIRRWSPLYKAAIQHLKEDINNRQTFLCYGDDENKVLYLKYATGVSRDAW